MLYINDICFNYGSKAILNNINLTVLPNDFISIIGHNGCGKTTFLKIMIGLLKPLKGSVIIDQTNIHTEQRKKTKKRLAYINQGSNNTRLPITVREVVNIGNIDQLDQEYIDQILNLLEIKPLQNQLFRNLSGGQKQKVNLARCLVQKPDLLFLDEPDSFLDQSSQKEIMCLIQELNLKNQMTIIMISHDLTLVEKYSKAVYMLDNKNLKKIS